MRDTCYREAAYSAQQQGIVDYKEITEDGDRVSLLNVEPPLVRNNPPTSRSIPISIETINSEESQAEGGENKECSPEIRTIPIEILNYEGEQKVKVKEIPEMSSARQIPIYRINTNNEASSAPQMPRTPSRESLGFASQKIKMGTSAIRIPIQVDICVHSVLGVNNDEYCLGREIPGKPSSPQATTINQNCSHTQTKSIRFRGGETPRARET